MSGNRGELNNAAQIERLQTARRSEDFAKDDRGAQILRRSEFRARIERRRRSRTSLRRRFARRLPRDVVNFKGSFARRRRRYSRCFDRKGWWRRSDFGQRRRLGFQRRQARKDFRLHGAPARHDFRRRCSRRLPKRFKKSANALFFCLRFAAARNRTAGRGRRGTLRILRLRLRPRRQPADKRDEHDQDEIPRMIEDARRNHVL